MTAIIGGNATVSQLLNVALRHESVSLATDSVDRIVNSREFSDQVATERPIYGRSTGVGANRTVAVHDPDGQLERLLRSHATGLGAARTPERVRAMAAIRVAQLAADGNGISLRAVQGLIDGLNQDNLPAVREGGSIGTGDLSALATIGVWLLDRPGGAQIETGDGLPLISSNAATLADAMLAVDRLEALAEVGMRCGAMVLRAVDGNPEAFSPAVDAASPYPGVARVTASVREHCRFDWTAARIQDPYALRAMPQIHGAALDAIARVRQIIRSAINAPTENPMLSAQHGVAHHGGFVAMHLAQALEAMLSAVASAAAGSLSRTTLLAEPNFTGLHPFLGDGTPGASGTMVAEYAAASRLAQLRAAAAPMSIHGISLSRTVEDDASFASTSALAALDAVTSWREMLAVELFTAARCLHQRGLPLPDEIMPLSAEVANDADRDLTGALDQSVELIRALTTG